MASTKPDDKKPLTDTVKDLGVYIAFSVSVWQGVMYIRNLWYEKYQLFWQGVWLEAILICTTAVVWFSRRNEPSAVDPGRINRVPRFSRSVQWITLGSIIVVPMLLAAIWFVYPSELHHYVTTPEFVTPPLGSPDEPPNVADPERYLTGEIDEKGVPKVAYGSLTLDFNKTDACKHIEITKVSVNVREYHKFTKRPQRAIGAEATAVRVIDYLAILAPEPGSYPAGLVRQPKQTREGNPLITDGLPIRVFVSVKAKKEGWYSVRGEIQVKCRGKTETVESEKDVLLACFENGKKP